MTRKMIEVQSNSQLLMCEMGPPDHFAHICLDGLMGQSKKLGMYYRDYPPDGLDEDRNYLAETIFKYLSEVFVVNPTPVQIYGSVYIYDLKEDMNWVLWNSMEREMKAKSNRTPPSDIQTFQDKCQQYINLSTETFNVQLIQIYYQNSFKYGQTIS